MPADPIVMILFYPWVKRDLCEAPTRLQNLLKYKGLIVLPLNNSFHNVKVLTNLAPEKNVF